MLRPISAELVRAFGEVHRGEIEPRVGAALATLANALVHVFQAGEHEDRIRQLEQRAHEEGLWRDHKGRDRGPIQWDD